MGKKYRKFMAGLLAAVTVISVLAGNSVIAEQTGGASIATESMLYDAQELCLTFDEESVEDSSNKQVETSLIGSADYVAGHDGTGKAIVLNTADSKGNYIDLGSDTALQPEQFTMSFWIKAPDTKFQGEELVVWFKPNGTWDGDGWYLPLNNGGAIAISVAGAAGTGGAIYMAQAGTNAGEFFPSNEWVHVGVTFDSSTHEAKFYKNGILQNITVTSPSDDARVVASDAVHKYIGCNSPGYNAGYLTAALDEFQLFSKVATKEELAELAELSDDKRLAFDKEGLTLTDRVSSDFVLKSKGDSGSSIKWSSNSSAVKIQDSKAVLVRGTKDRAVTLTAKLSLNGLTEEKKFQITVIKKSFTDPAESLNFTDVRIDDAFWSARQKQFLLELIPAGIAKVEEPAGGIPNLKEAAKKNRGKVAEPFAGSVYFLDSNPYKMIEAMSYALKIPSEGDADMIEAQNQIGEKLEEWIPYIEGAQESDGYLDTFFTLEHKSLPNFSWCTDKRWSDFALHELFVAGHFYEAAVAHFRATGDKRLLDVAVKNADHVDGKFGPEEGKWKQTPGHEEIEVALIKLAAACQEAGAGYSDKAGRYISLAKFFLDVRGDQSGRHGTNSYSGEYMQDHMLVKDQQEAVGHAVRAMYLYTAMADVARLEDTDIYDEALPALWDNVVNKKSYVTGGIGSSAGNEGFGEDYYLPNKSAYCETCANIGSVMWNQRLNMLYGDSQYADVMERTLYNSVISSVNFDGDKFFYANPMSSDSNEGRSAWSESISCPPNLMRVVESIGSYIYTQQNDVITLNLFIGSNADMSIKEQAVKLDLETQMPWYGKSKLTVTQAEDVSFQLRIRIPEWAAGANSVKVNDRQISNVRPDENGYLVIDRTWNTGDVITLDFPMTIERTHTPDEVKGNIGQTAVKRGPIVYAAESMDNDFDFDYAWLSKESKLNTEWTENFVNSKDEYGIQSGIRIKGKGYALSGKSKQGVLWNFIPYYAWNNRGSGEMRVYVGEEEVKYRFEEFADPNASFTSIYCSLKDIADEIPATYWHTWAGDTVRIDPWIEYSFEKPVELSGCSVNWMEDGTGVLVPGGLKIEYWDGEKFAEVTKKGEYTTFQESVYNDYEFETVETSKIRMTIKNGTLNGTPYAVGIYEWKLIGSMAHLLEDEKQAGTRSSKKASGE